MPELATFANGSLVRYYDFNDTYLAQEPAHPSDNIPAVLAVAHAAQRDHRRPPTEVDREFFLYSPAQRFTFQLSGEAGDIAACHVRKQREAAMAWQRREIGHH